MVSGRPCAKTLSGSVLVGLFHCQGSGAGVGPTARARWYMVSVWRTTAKVWTASKASVPGVWIRSPTALGLTGLASTPAPPRLPTAPESGSESVQAAEGAGE